MLLFLEIALAIAAWKNGWGARALLPLAGGFFVALLGGAAIGASGGSMGDARILGFFCDIGTIIVLGVMSRRSPAAEGSAPSVERCEEPVRLTDYSSVSGD